MHLLDSVLPPFRVLSGQTALPPPIRFRTLSGKAAFTNTASRMFQTRYTFKAQLSCHFQYSRVLPFDGQVIKLVWGNGTRPQGAKYCTSCDWLSPYHPSSLVIPSHGASSFHSKCAALARCPAYNIMVGTLASFPCSRRSILSHVIL